MIENFFKTYTDVMFAHFEPDLILAVVELTLNGLKDDP